MEEKKDERKLSNFNIFLIVFGSIIGIYIVYLVLKKFLYKPEPIPSIRDFTYIKRSSPMMEKIVPVQLTSSQLRQIFQK